MKVLIHINKQVWLIIVSLSLFTACSKKPVQLPNEGDSVEAIEKNWGTPLTRDRVSTSSGSSSTCVYKRQGRKITVEYENEKAVKITLHDD